MCAGKQPAGNRAQKKRLTNLGQNNAVLSTDTEYYFVSINAPFKLNVNTIVEFHSRTIHRCNCHTCEVASVRCTGKKQACCSITGKILALALEFVL